VAGLNTGRTNSLTAACSCPQRLAPHLRASRLTLIDFSRPTGRPPDPAEVEAGGEPSPVDEQDQATRRVFLAGCTEQPTAA
jgi:hypothetical protein